MATTVLVIDDDEIERFVGICRDEIGRAGDDGQGALGLVRRFQVISADPSAAAILRGNLAHQFDASYDAKRLSLPDGAFILDSSDPVTRTRA